jgi:RND family efflux transporter MFP subunit
MQSQTQENRPDQDRQNGAGDGNSPGRSDGNGHGHGSAHVEAPVEHLPHVSRGKMLLIFGVVALLFVVAFVARLIPQLAHDRELRQQATDAEKAPPVVSTTLPMPQAAVDELNLPADIHPWAQTSIFARVDGFLGRWTTDIGDHVEKNQLLAVIDAPDTDAELEQAQAALQQAAASIDRAQVNLQLATTTYDRYHGLLATGSVTQQDLDTRATAKNQAIADKAAADAAYKIAKANVDRLTVQQGFEKIYAPFSGTITFRNYDVGARISASDTTAGHELFDIADTDHLRVYVSVPQSFVSLIQANQPVQFVSQRNYGTRAFTGFVYRSAGALDPATRTLLTQLEFDNRQHLLWAGMYGEVHISVHREHPMLTIPTAAMLFEADGTQVAVVDDQNHVHFKKVTVGQDLGQRLEIVGGLNANERVVTNPGEKLEEGIEVSVAGGDKQANQPALASDQSAPTTRESSTVAANLPTTRVAQGDMDPPPGAGSGGSTR